jgi:dTMP kinase
MTTGKYIVIEGSDGTGKSTQVEMLAKRLEQEGIRTLQFHEPDGVEIAGKIRDVIKNGDLARSALTNVLLFSASRRENWLQQGRKHLDDGGWIVSARDYTSTLVYQGIGEGIPLATIEEITTLATDERYMSPDYRFILDIDNETERLERIKQRGELAQPDTFESKDDDFQHKVLEGYRIIAREKAIPIVSASQSVDAIHQDLWSRVKNSL